MKKIGISLVAWIIICHLTGMATALPLADPNIAVHQVSSELKSQFSEGVVGLIPLNIAQPELDTISQVLTRMLAFRLGIETSIVNSVERNGFATNEGVLSVEQVKQYGKALACQWLITGQLTQLPNLSIHINLFLWDTDTGHLKHWANIQLSPSPAVMSLFGTMPTGDGQPYYLKWSGLPHPTDRTLAIDVADVDGDGYNELIVADEKRARIQHWTGVNFLRSQRLPEIEYRSREAATLANERRTLLVGTKVSDQRDEVYISASPDQTWQLKWKPESETSAIRHQPLLLLAYGEGLGITAKPLVYSSDASNPTVRQREYAGNSTAFLQWQTAGNRLSWSCALPNDYHSITSRVINPDSSARTGEILVVDLDGHLQAYRFQPNHTRLVWQTPPLFGEGIAIGDLKGDKTPEIAVTAKDVPVASDGAFYDQFIILERKDDLYTISWTSPFLSGRIVDLKIADADNDDQNELILILRTRQGTRILLYAATD